VIKPSTIVRQIKSDNEKRLELVIEAAAVGIWDWQLQTEEITFNQRWAEIIGYTTEELSQMNFEIWKDKVHSDDLSGALECIEKHLNGTFDLYSAEIRMRHKEGHYIWVLESGRVVEWDANGLPTRMLGASFDISERKSSEQELIVTSQLLQETQAISKVGGWELNLETGDLYWTDETYRLHDTSPEEFNPSVDAGVSYFLPDSREEISLAIEQAIEHGINYDLELETLTTKGRKIDVRTTCHVTQVNGKSVRLTGIFQDISEQKEIQRKLELTNLNLEEANAALLLSAHYDELTGLPNRILLSDRIQQAMTKSLRHKQSMAVAFIDFDGFKWINDSYGHSVGDQFLRLITQKLKHSLRAGDTLARIGGDEFVAVIEELDSPEDSHAILLRLLEAAANEININGNRLKTTASIGVTFYPENNCSPDQLLRSADQAMYKAKQLGKDCWHIFDTERDFAVKHKREEIERIRQALYNREFVLFYQPKIDLRSKQLVGMEALIRWNHPEQGILPPIAFLPILEHDLLSIELGEWVIHTALEQLESWRSTPLEVPISVNISPMQLQHSDFVLRLEDMLKKFPARNANHLEFEILESSALENIDLASGVITQCKELGVAFSIDDFGTGYSSLSYLKQIPAEYLKIDQSFVRDMLLDADDRTIIKGIIELSKAFKLKVIAEGVETPEHGEELASLGCFLAQGYGIAKPMPASDMLAWVKRWQDNPVLVDGSV
jgi:diguanylate cyclase (GGDEF)-like protein/PAS domain S-box-containing protein